MEETLPTNSRRVGASVITRERAGQWTIVFLNGPRMDHLTADRVLWNLVNQFGADAAEAKRAVMDLMRVPVRRG